MRLKTYRWSVLIVTAAVALLWSATATADKGDDDWYKKFKGHKMWMTDLNKGKELSKKEDRPMLIDFFSPG